MKDKSKLIILTSIIIGVLVVVLSFTYAFFTFDRAGTNQELVLGDIWMKYEETNGILLENALPGEEYSSYFEFTITGKNTYEEKDIWYDIRLTKGSVPDGKTEDNRIEDKYLKFKLVEVNNEVETEIFTDKTYDDLTNQTVHVATIPKSTNEYSKTYRLYMVISEELLIGNVEGAISSEDFETLFGSIKVATTGDFTEKYLSGADLIISKYGTEENLVAINTEGTLYEGTGEIREYRYSGATANNYVIFNDDGDETVEANELWRIVGVFKNTEGNWNLKLMRDNMLGEDEVPNSYTINGNTYIFVNGYEDPINYEPTIEEIPGSFMTNGVIRLASLTTPTTKIVWNSTFMGSIGGNDWTVGGLQYFLNTTQDSNGTAGYYSTFTTEAKNLIDENYEYYLGNVYNSYDDGPNVINTYNAERGTTECASTITINTHDNGCNIWYGNEPTWNGAISLLYPSDYGYSVDLSYWSGTISSGAASTSWMQQTANHSDYYEWFLSPSSIFADHVLHLTPDGIIYYLGVGSGGVGARPVLNLIAEATMEDAEGTSNSPYVIVGE